jgi:6-phosphogluconolactonase (cycloisomerase 2 family)
MVAAGALAATATAASAHPDRDAGSVYTLTNSPAGNAVLAFDRAPDGRLAPRGSYPTGGTGTGAGLGSQGALVLDKDGRELFAVNAASNSITAFRVRRGGLELDATVPTGGATPISVTVHDDTLYVLNAGGTANITGFDVSGHGLTPIPNSTRPLSAGSAGPAQVSFSPDGHTLVVTEKGSSTIDTFHVGRHGVVGTAVAHPSAGGTPFGFDFDKRGNVLVSNATGSASSYDLGRHNELTVISDAVPTGQGAPCWLVTSTNGRFAYTANAGGGTISGFRVGRDGSLALLTPGGATADLGTGSHPLDEAVTTDGRYLYNLTDGQHAITGLRIGVDGSLTTVSTTGDLPAGTIGIAAD